MKGDIPMPAFRLLATLKVTTHLAPEPVSKTTAFNRARRAALSYRLPQPIRINGREFASINAARKTLHLSSVAIEKMLEEGRAEYV